LLLLPHRLAEIDVTRTRDGARNCASSVAYERTPDDARRPGQEGGQQTFRTSDGQGRLPQAGLILLGFLPPRRAYLDPLFFQADDAVFLVIPDAMPDILGSDAAPRHWNKLRTLGPAIRHSQAACLDAAGCPESGKGCR